ncbi:hypothetical protein ACIOJE_14500 [Kitasatospora sp. NPDC087861]|uniref:hypothetical protein n=1 Tax=Kitasatospora sp. NPDC087861 TaxID=3364070 RepID=UPI00381620CE
MNSTIATAVEQPTRRLVRLVSAAGRQDGQDRQDGAEPPHPAPAATVGHDRGRPAHCRIAMHFED